MKQKSSSPLVKFLLLIVALLAAILLLSAVTPKAQGVTQFPPGSLLQPEDVTSSHIRNGTIVNADVSNSAAIAASKVATATDRDFVTNGQQTISGLKIFATVPQTTGGGCSSGNDLCNKTYVDSLAGRLQATVTTGQGLSPGDAVYIRDVAGGNVSWLAVSTTTDNDIAVGFSTANNVSQCTKCAQSFVPTLTEYLSHVTLKIKKHNNPADNFEIAIQADAAGSPSGTDLATSTIASGSLTASYAPYTLALSSAVQTSSSTTYWIVYRRSGALDDNNAYLLDGSTTNDYSAGGMYASSSSWTAMTVTKDSQFTALIAGIAGRAYKTSALATSTSNAFFGFAAATSSASSTAAIDIHGVINNFSGLTAGSQYYLANATGTIGSAAGSVSRKVGISASSTALLITNIW